MAGFKLKKLFAGKFIVLSADDEQVFGPDRMAACQAWISDNEGSPQFAAASSPDEPEVDEVEARRREREWARKVDADLKKPLSEEQAELRALLEKRRKPDEVDYLMRTFEPILAAGLEGARRERGQFIQVRRSAAA